VSYVVLGCGAIGGTVAAWLARDGHDVLVSDPDPAVVAAVSAGGLRVEGPGGGFTVAVPATAPDDLPARLDGPVLVAVRAQDMAAAGAQLAGRLDGAGYVVCLRHGLDAGVLTEAVGPGRVAAAWAGVDAAEVGPGVVRLGDRAAVLVGELDGLYTERAGLFASHIPGAQLTGRILGCLQSGLAQDVLLAVTGLGDQPAAEVLGDPRYRPLLHQVAREVLAGAPVPPAPAGAFDPADLPGSLARLAQAARRSANPYSEVYLDLAMRHRPADLPADLGERGGPLVRRLTELLRAIEQGRRSCSPSNLDLLAAH
jgi:2-dehydropantoate 2-reductase